MKPPAFDYLRPSSVDGALEALGTPGAVVLAGGQSLLLELVYRDVRPSLVVDVNDLTELTELGDEDGAVSIGALVRHRRLESSDAGGPVRRLLAKAAPFVAHPPIRARGTFGGSVAWAHPAAEWNAIARATDALVTLRSARGERRVPAAEWYRGRCRSAADPDELLVRVQLAGVPATTGTGFAEHRRTHASFADVAVAALVSAHEGVIDAARIGIVGISDVPVRAGEVEDSLLGVGVDAAPGRARESARLGDGHLPAVARALVGRAVDEAVREL